MVFDLEEALARARGKRALLRKMAELFLADCPGLLGRIRTALAAGDGPALERAAHRMKGSAANLSAARVVEVAGRLEEIGRGEPARRRPTPRAPSWKTRSSASSTPWKS